jgi:hypothetical protein
MIRVITLWIALTSFCGTHAALADGEPRRPNVLFILVDDK